MKVFTLIIFITLIIIGFYWLIWGFSAFLLLVNLLQKQGDLAFLMPSGISYLAVLGFVTMATVILVNIFNLGVYGKWIITGKLWFGMKWSIVIAAVTILGLLFLGFNEIRNNRAFNNAPFDVQTYSIYFVELFLIIHFVVRRNRKSVSPYKKKK